MGHTALLQYYCMHLSGYPDMTLAEIRKYHSGKPDTLCTRHPERSIPGVEVTTGAFGQGLANAIGLAMASKHLAAHLNRPSLELINNHCWCIVGDGCLQEGLAM
jgi:dihydroxyacetone synthase